MNRLNRTQPNSHSEALHVTSRKPNTDAATRSKNIGENSGEISGAVRPQPHGGALLSGGAHGRGAKGRSGRRPQKIRKASLALFAKNLPVLGHIAAGVTTEFVENGAQVLVTPRPAERVSAMKLLADIGMGEKVSVGEVKARLREQFRVLREILPPDKADLACKALIDVWS